MPRGFTLPREEDIDVDLASLLLVPSGTEASNNSSPFDSNRTRSLRSTPHKKSNSEFISHGNNSTSANIGVSQPSSNPPKPHSISQNMGMPVPVAAMPRYSDAEQSSLNSNSYTRPYVPSHSMSAPAPFTSAANRPNAQSSPGPANTGSVTNIYPGVRETPHHSDTVFICRENFLIAVDFIKALSESFSKLERHVDREGLFDVKVSRSLGRIL